MTESSADRDGAPFPSHPVTLKNVVKGIGLLLAIWVLLLAPFAIYELWRRGL